MARKPSDWSKVSGGTPGAEAAKPTGVTVSPAEYRALKALNSAAGTNFGQTQKQPTRAARKRRALRNVNAALGSSFKSLRQAKSSTRAEVKRTTASDNRPPKQSALQKAGAPYAADLGVLRAIGGDAIAIGSALNPAHPRRALKTLEHSAGQVKDIAVGTGGLAALVGNSALLPVQTALAGGSTKPAKELGAAYSQLGKGFVKQVSKDHGPLYRGEKGAQGKRNQQLQHEGVTNAIADLSVGIGGGSAGLGAAARTAADAGRGGELVAKVADATRARPALRTGAGKAAVRSQKVSSGVVGAGVRRGIDKARIAKQSAREREAATGQAPKIRAALHKPARGLEPHRAALGGGEVAPLLNTSARIAQARRAGADIGDATHKAGVLSARLVTGAKGARKGELAGITLRNATKGLSDAQAIAATYANRLGIRDSVAGKAAVDRRIAQVTQHVEELRAKGAEKGAGYEPQVLQELDGLHALSAHPQLFDDPAVHAAAAALHDVGHAVAKGHGLTPDTARAVNADLQARHIGAEPRREAQPARVAVDDKALGEARGRAAKAETAVRAAEREHSAARESLARARGRAEVGSRNVGGVAAEREAGRPVQNATFAAGGHGVREAAAKLVDSAGKLDAARADLKAANLEVAHHARGVKVPAQPAETAGEFADRVEAQAMAEHGLHPSGYQTSRFNAPEDVSGATKGTHGLGTKHREGTNFDTGAEIHGHPAIRATEKAHQTRLRRFERAGAVSDTLEREGTAFSSKAEAESFARQHKLEPGTYDIVGGEVHGGVVRSSARTANLHTVGSAQRGKDLGADFAPTGAVYVIPRQVKDSLDALTKPPGAGGRALDKVKAVTSVSLLGLNPSWIQFQTIADGIVAGAAGVTPADIARAAKIRRGWDDTQRETLALLSGHGGASDILRSSDVLTGAESILRSNGVYRKFFEGRRPLTVLVRADAARTGLVRDAALLKRLANSQRTADIDEHITALRPLQGKLISALASADPERLAAALKGPEAIEAAAHITKIMGDFSHYTAFERNYLRRVLPFYGFLRYSTRLAFYTLPVDHPLVGLLLAEIGKTSAEEQKTILGGDAPPYMLGAIYNKDGTRKTDFSRANPLGNSLFGGGNAAQFGAAFLPPVALPIFDAYLAGNSAFRGNKAYTFKGGLPVTGDKLTLGQRNSIFLSELLGLIPPVRIGGKLLHPGSQSTGDNFGVFGSSALPFPSHDGSLGHRLQQGLLPIATSSAPTDDKDIAARARKAKLNKASGSAVAGKPKGSSGGLFSGGSGQGGGLFGGGSGGGTPLFP